MRSQRGAAFCRSVRACIHLLVANPFLPLGLGMETCVQIGGLAACILTNADKRRMQNAFGSCFVVTLIRGVSL